MRSPQSFRLQAQTEASIAEAREVIPLIEQWVIAAEFAYELDDSSLRIEAGEDGVVVFSTAKQTLHISLGADTDFFLFGMKSALHNALSEICKHLDSGFDADEGLKWSDEDPQQASTPSFFREMRVLEASNFTPRLRRVRLFGENLQSFASDGLHVRMVFPPPSQNPASCWPSLGRGGRLEWPDPPCDPDTRAYTIRHADPSANWLEIDMVLHEDAGTGSSWAAAAKPGDLVGILGPTGKLPPPADCYLLAGDETSMPYIARVLEALPPHCKAFVRITVENEAEQQVLTSPAELDLQWVIREGYQGENYYTDGLVEAVRQVPWSPSDFASVYAWAACEGSGAKALNTVFQQEMKLPRRRYVAGSYWHK